MATTKKCYIWKNLNKTWNSVNWKWSECELVEELIQNLEGTCEEIS